jgi:hypothetical protein
MRRTREVMLVLLFALLGAARAQAATIVIVRPDGASPELTETVSRLHGELLSLGLAVAFAERAGPPARPTDPRARLQPIADTRDADAVIELGGELNAATVDIYVLDRRTRRSEVSRVALESAAGDSPARLAIRTIEVLRSHLVEIDLAARARPDPIDVHAAAAAVSATPSPAAPAERVGLEAGAAVLTGVDGVGPALLPTVRVGWATRSGLVLHAALAGFGSRPTLTAPAGSARVAQQFGLLGISTGGPSGKSIRPFIRPYVALAAGVLRTAIDGEASAPAEAHFVDRWSLLLDGSVGARVGVPGRTFVTLAAHVQVATPHVAVHIADSLVATIGNPNVLLTLTVGAWL